LSSFRLRLTIPRCVALSRDEIKKMSDWYREETTAVLQALHSDPTTGLSHEEAAQRLQQYGPNELEERGQKSIFTLIFAQLSNVLIIVLILAAIVSLLIGEASDAIVILAIVLLNTILGVSQEYRAEQAMAALKQMAVPTVRVRRNGELQEISARELVPGDIVLLEAGNIIPADGRVLESINLKAEEAALTGESEPVDKISQAIASPNQTEIPLGDRKNSLFMGTLIVYGRGTMLVTATGMKTEIGHIANLLQNVQDEQTPLQQRLDGLGRTLAIIAAFIIVLIFALGVWQSAEIALLWAEGAPLMAYLQSKEVQELFLTGISMAVAVVPESLPAVVTICLALGSQRLLRRHALIRKLPAVETLGSVTTICSDKTGTLTQNKMTVTYLSVAGEETTVEALVAKETPLPHVVHTADAPAPLQSLLILLEAAVLCNDGTISTNEAGEQVIIGDPTETALIVAGEQLGLSKQALEASCPRVGELPFTSERKRMSTLHRVGAGLAGAGMPWQDAPYVAFTKGAMDGLLDIAPWVWMAGQILPLTPELRQRIEQENEALAQRGERVLGMAFRVMTEVPALAQMGVLEEELVVVGLVGMIDPPREEVRTAVAECHTAGIRPIMITGDHPLTAMAIADKLNISRNGKVYTGVQLAQTSPEQLREVVKEVSVYARVSPEHKLNIVRALQENGEVAAMTGDGVNDAPALRQADIGVAMGITGTDVSKEAADMVLLDDNFATIVTAVREGRTIYDNIRKFIKYTLSSNTGELFVMVAAPFVGMPLPLLPTQILWINLVTDGVPGLALAVEKAEQGTMNRPPQNPNAGVFANGLGSSILWTGILMGILSLGVGFWGFSAGL
jgi:P-type Ca2+ transporter type 2C